MCVPWELNPQPLRCSCNALPLSRRNTKNNKSNQITFNCRITTAQVPWWVKFLRAPACSRQCKKTKQQFTYGQYIFTDCTEDNVQNTHTYTQYTQCTIKTYFVTNAPIHIIHRIYTSALCPHLCIVICEGVTDYNLQWIGCATDSCARCNKLCIRNVVGVLLWCPVIADRLWLVQCVRVVQLNCVKVQCMACCVSGSVM